MATHRTPNTVKAYRNSWLVFERWCLSAGRCPLPATLDSVRLFVSWATTPEAQGGGEYRLNSVNHCLASIASKHREAGLPVPLDPTIRILINCAARKLQEEPGGKLALTPEQLTRAAGACDIRKEIGLRDRAILLVGFASGWRASELSRLNLSDVHWVARGFELRLRKSKTDQQCKGRLIGIPPGKRLATCPVRALKAWIFARGSTAGPLFPRTHSGSYELLNLRLSPIGVCGVVKRALDRVGIDSSDYGAHSLRAGFVTAAADAGASELSIMRRTGHRSVAMVLKYVRPATAFAVDPLAGVL